MKEKKEYTTAEKIDYYVKMLARNEHWMEIARTRLNHLTSGDRSHWECYATEQYINEKQKLKVKAS